MYLPECSFKDKVWWDAWRGGFILQENAQTWVGSWIRKNEYRSQERWMFPEVGGWGQERERKELLGPPGRGDFAIGDARGGHQVVAEENVKSTVSSISLHVAQQCFCVGSGSFWAELQEEGHLMTSGDIHWTLIITQENENRKLSLHCNSRN